MKLKRLGMTGLLLALIAGQAFGQNGTTTATAPQNFSLKEAQEYAVLNSYKTQSSSLDVEIAKKQVKQYTSIGLPQISASGKLMDYVDIPTTLLPGELMGMPPGSTIPVHFGTKYNMSGSVDASQLIFDGTYIIGLKTAKVYVEMTRMSQLKSQQEVRETVTQTYYLILVAKENRKLIDSTIAVLQKTYKQTSEFQKNGFVENTDVDQIQLLITNMESRLAMVDRQIELAEYLLKFQMGMDITTPITLTDGLQDLLNQAIAVNLVDKDFQPQNHIDYRLFSTSNEIARLQYKMDKFKYMPSLVGIGSLSYSAQRNDFTLFKSGSEYPWYRTTVVGLSLSVPIWSSGSRYYKIQMSKYTLQKNEVTLKQLNQALTLDVLNAKSTMRTYTTQYQNDLNNLDLSKKIYDKTLVKYKEGVATSMELTQAHNQYLTAQGSYFNTVMELFNAQSKLNKALNNY
jgi:outer membrane protein TolC